MPAKAKHLRNRASNFYAGVKRVIQSFSPRKKAKIADTDSDKENAKASTSPSDVSIDLPSPDSVIDDVFLATSSHAKIDAPGHFPVPYGSYFHRTSSPDIPTSPPAQFYHEYTLPPPPPPSQSRRATVEEVPDEDDVSQRASQSTTSLDSVNSHASVPEPEAAEFQQAAAADPQAQDAYTRVYDALSAPGRLREAPTIAAATAAVKDLAAALRGVSRGASKGYKDPKHDPFVRHRLEGMRTFLNLYIDTRSKTYGHWGASALQASIGLGRGRHCMRTLCKLARQYIHDRSLLLVNPYGDWKESLLADEDIATDINLYLQESGNDITAEKVSKYLARPEVMEKHGITKTISIRTARRYLNALGYRYHQPKKGQYSDGHERPDVVYERDKVYIPAIRSLERRMHRWSKDNEPEYGPRMPGRRVILWNHDESVFYAHERKRKNWYHKDAAAKLHQKGDGHSLMVADFVSADFGWSPTSLDGKRTARRFLKPGKGREGYFTTENILEQAEEFMDILDEVYPEFEHHFIYDNATIHRKRPDGSLSARLMPKFTSSADKNFGVTVTARDADGQPIYTTSGRLKKIKIQMTGAEFNGQPQSLYFPENHPLEGLFKGMAVILEARGLGHETKSSREDDLERNVRAALDAVPLEMMRRFGNRSSKFVDAYARGLNGRQAAWAARKYRGHRVIPESIMEELDAAGIV
ncbi:hypothetical protein B0H17DRAFT_1213092 [Mycena rosella]|uniref:Uncharacterized protein n=1 Tax=Mycena rosella TaxID=1033263 RepID=A0AAD7CQY0_MYCRO|nr:hypothetical protein B0H17DRAFT_1213092 [Mycena rosella]